VTKRRLTVMQVLPEFDVGGVERGTVEIAAALSNAGHRAIVVSAPGKMVSELNMPGARHIPLAVGAKRPGSIIHILALRNIIRNERVDVVHARSRLPAWLAYLALRSLRGSTRPAWLTTVHGPYTVNRYSRIMVSGDAVIAISHYIKDYICDSYPRIDKDRISVIPRGVERSDFSYKFAPSPGWLKHFKRDHPQLYGKELLTLPGRLTRWKGQLGFIDLIAELRRRGRSIHGLIVGGAHQVKEGFQEELNRAVRHLRLEDDITFLGHRNDLREILAISTIVYSLTNEPEAFGRTTIEALSLGVPVIGYEHGGTAEILTAVFPGGLVDVFDIQTAADRTEQFLRELPTVPNEHPYTTERLQGATLSLYQKITEDREPRWT